MILMTVRNDKSLHLLNIILQKGNIRYHKINSQHIILRECQSAVHDNNTVSVHISRNIHSDLFQTAERNNL